MRVLVAIDKFKESLTSIEAATIIKEGILLSRPKTDISFLPIADGGDGFANVLKYYLKTKTVKVKSVDPLFKPIQGYYEWSSVTKTAVIELAVCSGIALIKTSDRNPLNTSTYGTGLLIQHAIKKGAKKIILGLGGSATNDAGIGIASALGFVFLDKMGNELMPIGASLNHIHKIIPPAKKEKVIFEIATDVNNPLFGKNGAAYVYAPQKGANEVQVNLLDKGLRNISNSITKITQCKLSKVKGVGAAGGVATMLMPYYRTRIIGGIDLIMELSDFEKNIKKCDLLITGEGKIDSQSFQGKVVGTLIQRAIKFKKPIILIAGKIGDINPSKLKKIEIIELIEEGMSVQYSIKNAKKLLLKKVTAYFKHY
jgi:glycerate kinase